MLGMMFGVGAVIAMLSIGAGAEQQALRTIDRLGVRNVVIRDKEFKPSELAEIRKKSLGLSTRDVDAIREGVPGVELVVARARIDVYKILSSTGKAEGQVYGVSHEYSKLVHLQLEKGRFLDAHDDETRAQFCVIGSAVGRDLFGIDPALGGDVKINDLWCEVVGVLADDALDTQAGAGPSSGTGRDIYMPITTATRKLEKDPLKSPLDEIVACLAPGTSPRQTEAVIQGLLGRLHGGVVDYDTIVPEALLAQSRQTQRLFNVVMGAIASISLLVGGIGIMNIMLASVLELTREIGVRRAVGARRRDIRFQFLVNAFTLSLVGALAGIFLGIVLGRVVSNYAGWPTVVTATSLFVSTGVSVAVGLVSGLYPAIRAARLNPIEALRYE